jgi:hypothetical protein
LTFAPYDCGARLKAVRRLPGDWFVCGRVTAETVKVSGIAVWFPSVSTATDPL